MRKTKNLFLKVEIKITAIILFVNKRVFVHYFKKSECYTLFQCRGPGPILTGSGSGGPQKDRIRIRKTALFSYLFAHILYVLHYDY